jgi:hypothetical protein
MSFWSKRREMFEKILWLLRREVMVMAMAHQTQLSHNENEFDVPETKNRVSSVNDDSLEIGQNAWFLFQCQRCEWEALRKGFNRAGRELCRSHDVGLPRSVFRLVPELKKCLLRKWSGRKDRDNGQCEMLRIVYEGVPGSAKVKTAESSSNSQPRTSLVCYITSEMG